MIRRWTCSTWRLNKSNIAGDYAHCKVRAPLKPEATQMMRNHDTGPTAEEPASNSGNDPETARRLAQERRIARERREAEHQKQAPWVDPREIAGEGNPHELETAVRSGRVRIRFVHTSRWWQRKEAIAREAIRIGSDGRSLMDSGHWELRVNKDDWRAYLEKPAAPASSADVPPPATEIRKESNAGAPPQYDWDEASQYIEKLWENLGDPRDPLNAKDGWKSDYDIARSVVDHLEELYPDQEPPPAKTVADKLRPKIKRLRGD
jgi:hypothetical protein